MLREYNSNLQWIVVVLKIHLKANQNTHEDSER